MNIENPKRRNKSALIFWGVVCALLSVATPSFAIPIPFDLVGNTDTNNSEHMPLDRAWIATSDVKNRWEHQNHGENLPVPEPATLLLLGSGLIALAGFGRRLRTGRRGRANEKIATISSSTTSPFVDRNGISFRFAVWSRFRPQESKMSENTTVDLFKHNLPVLQWRG